MVYGSELIFSTYSLKSIFYMVQSDVSKIAMDVCKEKKKESKEKLKRFSLAVFQL